MAVPRLTLAEHILVTLREARQPLAAAEIAHQVRRRLHPHEVARKDVNSVLYRELSGKVVRDDNYGWKAVVPESSENTQSEVPVCEQCSAPMRLRTAGRGPRAGTRFWGCSAYPRCTYTRDLFPGEETQQEPRPLSPKARPENPRLPGDALPRRGALAPTRQGRKVLLLESAALPRSFVTALGMTPVPPEITRAFAQWALEIPQSSGPNPAALPILGLASKFVSRGRVLPLSRRLEAIVCEECGCRPAESPEELLDCLEEAALTDLAEPLLTDFGTAGQTIFDSEEESAFYHSVGTRFLGSGLSRWLIPQVGLGGLTGNRGQQDALQRVDFLLAHPDGHRHVIEIDGAHHEGLALQDGARDKALREAGFQVHRIPAREVHAGQGVALASLREQAEPVMPRPAGTVRPQVLLCLVARRIHQIQVGLLQACLEGILPLDDAGRVEWLVHIGPDPALERVNAARVAEEAVTDFGRLLRELADLHGASICDPVIRLLPSGSGHLEILFREPTAGIRANTALVRDIFLPFNLARPEHDSPKVDTQSVDREACRLLLDRVFGFEEFREGQFEAIERSLLGKDSIVLLPTGSGKSAAFQLATLLRAGPGIIVAPLLSLIDDQIENLRAHGIDRVTSITGEMHADDKQAIQDLIAQGEYLFAYVSPERFQVEEFRRSLRALTVHTPIAQITVDEAHCVSEWGHDFRPSYLNLGRVSRECCSFDHLAPPLMALTGTASRAVLKDLQRELQIDDFEAIITPRSFDRPELTFEILPCRSQEKSATLVGSIGKIARSLRETVPGLFEPRRGDTYGGLVFCPAVNGEFGVARVASDLTRKFGVKVPCYSGRPPKGFGEMTWKHLKRETALGFKKNAFPVLACTKAFGMGIDKPNIRYTVHYNLPPSIEAFYQEAGRAGRDRRPARCIVIFSNDFPDRNAKLLQPVTPVEQIADVAGERSERASADDITRLLYFHQNSFRGAMAEIREVERLLDAIGDLENPRQATVAFASDKERETRERAVHRLVTVGFVADYTMDHSGKAIALLLPGADREKIASSFHRYVALYQRARADQALEKVRRQFSIPFRAFLVAVCREVVEFVYEVVERSRRRSLSEMLALCENARNDAGIRKRVEDYFGSSEFTERLLGMIESSDLGVESALTLLDDIRSAIDAAELRGQTSRLLEAYPDHPGLLVLRAVSEAMTDSPNADTIHENLKGAVQFGLEAYGMAEVELARFAVEAALRATSARRDMGPVITEGILRAFPEPRAVARSLLARLGHPAAAPALNWLVQRLSREVEPLLKR